MEESILDIIQSIQDLKKTVNDLRDKQSSIQIQNGNWEVLDGWDIPNDISKEVNIPSDREVKQKINFDKPFNKTPKIHAGLSHLDTDSDTNNIRIRVVIEDITKEGFTLKVQTWIVSRIFGFKVEWLAYTCK